MDKDQFAIEVKVKLSECAGLNIMIECDKYDAIVLPLEDFAAKYFENFYSMMQTAFSHAAK